MLRCFGASVADWLGGSAGLSASVSREQTDRAEARCCQAMRVLLTFRHKSKSYSIHTQYNTVQDKEVGRGDQRIKERTGPFDCPGTASLEEAKQYSSGHQKQ